VASGRVGRQNLARIAMRELPRSSRPEDATRDANALIADIDALIESYFGSTPQRGAILSPALPFDIVDGAGRRLAEPTDGARELQGGSWHVPLPRAANGQQIAIHLDATLDVPGHPGLLAISGFHANEGTYRWTGPEPLSTITIPLALTVPT